MPDNNDVKRVCDRESLESQPARTESEGEGAQGGQKEGYEGRRQGDGSKEQNDSHSGQPKSDK